MEMEIPVINRIGDFEAGIASLQNPSFVSQIFSLSPVGKFHQPFSVFKWGALILAFVASFATIIKRIKFLIFRLHNHFFPPPSPNTIQHEYSYDSDTDSSCSSLSSEDDEDENEEEEEEADYEPTVSFSSQNWRSIDEDFSVKGSDHQCQNRSLRKRRNHSIEDLFSSFSELTNGKSVVKLWDNLGLGLRFSTGNEWRNHISVYDTNSDRNLLSIFGEESQIPAVSVSSSSPAVIVSSETNVSGNLLKVWDTRVGGRLPGILAEWRPKLGKIVGIGGGLAKVYVRNDVTGRLTVGDLRKVRSPLAVTESVDEVSGGDSVFRRG
ncbi:uncharacterized protein [Euphorbia lathyris]|uniref:uncharacterized protein n=1 Tax=Euphorbia lathyris TaxID=212925 RepID=UPI0033142655